MTIRTSLVLAALAATALVSASGGGADGSDIGDTLVSFPEAFVVTTGTTIPFTDVDPVAQSGTINFDYARQRVRIDTYWMGNQRTFIADLKAQRGYVVNNAACVASKLTGKLKRMGVPRAASVDPDRAAVRGVSMAHYSATLHVDDSTEVSQMDYYVKHTNFTVVNDRQDTTIVYNVPWRVTSHRSSRRELAQRPSDAQPNWRYYGEPLHDEIVLVHGSSAALSKVIQDISVTTDFFNFVPMVPDDSAFEPPAMCDTAGEAHTFDHDVDVMEAQRNLQDLAFNNEEGRRLMDQLWHPKKRLSDGNDAAAQEEL